MKRIICFTGALVLLLACCLSFSGCKKSMDRYLSVVPTDVDYKATMTNRLQTEIGDYTKQWKVLRKTTNVAGENQTVIYVEYALTDNENEANSFERTLMYVKGEVYALEGENWVPYTGSFGDKWSDIYGSYSAPGSFVYEMTQKINGRDFPTKLKNKTSEYLEYDFGTDNEVFRISNNAYHLLLYYTFDYGTTHERQDATFVIGSPTDEIPYASNFAQNLKQASACFLFGAIDIML